MDLCGSSILPCFVMWTILSYINLIEFTETVYYLGDPVTITHLPGELLTTRLYVYPFMEYPTYVDSTCKLLIVPHLLTDYLMDGTFIMRLPPNVLPYYMVILD